MLVQQGVDKFTEGMNFAFALLAALVLANLSLFDDPRQRALLAGVFAATHAGQFLCNVPIAMGGGMLGLLDICARCTVRRFGQR
jgi:hypothetical protein